MNDSLNGWKVVFFTIVNMVIEKIEVDFEIVYVDFKSLNKLVFTPREKGFFF
jgi:hypothetical protein